VTRRARERPGPRQHQGLQARAKAIPPQGQRNLADALGRLVHLYDAWDKPDQAAAWRQRLTPQAKTPTKGPDQ
jgi:hypothetical protein